LAYKHSNDSFTYLIVDERAELIVTVGKDTPIDVILTTSDENIIQNRN